MGSSQSKDQKVAKANIQMPKSNTQQTQVEKDLSKKPEQPKTQPVVQNQAPKSQETVVTSKPNKPLNVSNIPAEEKKEHVVQTTHVVAKTEVSQPVEHKLVEEPKTVENQEKTEVALNKKEAEELKTSVPETDTIRPIIQEIKGDLISAEEIKSLPSHHVEQTLQAKTIELEEPIDTTPTMFHAQAVKQPIHHHIQPETVHEKTVNVENEAKETEIKIVANQQLVDEKVENVEVGKVVKEEEQAQAMKAEGESIEADMETPQVITEPVTSHSEIEFKETVCGLKENTFGHDNSTPEDRQALNETIPVVDSNVTEPVEIHEPLVDSNVTEPVEIHEPLVDSNVTEPVEIQEANENVQTDQSTELKEATKEMQPEIVQEVPKTSEPTEPKKGKGKKGKKGKQETTNEDKTETQ